MEDGMKKEQNSNNTDNSETNNESSSNKVSPNSVKGKKARNHQYYGTGKLPCPDLGPGWHFEQVIRQQGKSAGRYDTYYHSPSNVKVRSKLKLQQLVSSDLKNFDFNAGKFIENSEQRGGNKQRRKQSSLHHAHLKTVESPPKKPYVTLSNGKIKISGLLQSGYLSRMSARKLKRKRQNSTNKSQDETAEPVNTEKLCDTKTEDTSSGIQSFENSAISSVENNFTSSLTSSTQNNSPGTSSSADIALKNDTTNIELSPYALFKKEALSHAAELIDDPEQIECLISCAWSYLSVESKSEFEGISISLGYQASDSNREYASQVGDMHHFPVVDQVVGPHESPIKKPRKSRNSTDLGFFSQRRKRCGICQGCQAENCGMCSNCKDMKKFGGSGRQKKSCVRRKCEEIYSMDNSFSSQFYFAPSSKPMESQKSLVWQSGEKEDCLTNYYHISDSSGSNGEFPLDGMLDEGNSEMNSSHSDVEPSNSSFYSVCVGLSNPKISEIPESNAYIPNLKQNFHMYNVPSLAHQQDCSNKIEPISFSNEERPNKRKSRPPICIKQTPTSFEAEDDFLFIKEETH